MLRIIFVAIYYALKWLLYPLEYAWNKTFRIGLRSIPKQILILDVIGGSGKSELATKCFNARQSFAKHSTTGKIKASKLIRADLCKYGDNWRRFTGEEFVNNVNNEIEQSDHFIFEGTYYDERLPEQRSLIDDIINRYPDATVIWIDNPRWVTVWRKMFRSFKRAIGATPQGAAVEHWHNVRAMVEKTYNQFYPRYPELDQLFNVNKDKSTFKRVHWPYFYDV